MVNNTPVALITGGSGGLGRELSLRFAKEGYAVAVHYRSNAKQAQETVRAIEAAGGKAAAFCADIGRSEDVDRLFDEVTQRLGVLDTLVHAAGNTGAAVLPRLTYEAFDDVLRTHLKGAFLCTQAAAKIMRKPRTGSIVYIGSILGLRGVAGECNYGAAKAGLIGLAKSAAKELGAWGICVNVVLPGFMQTKMGQEVAPEFAENAKKENVLGRWTEPADTARMVVELSRARWISGQVLNFDARIP